MVEEIEWELRGRSAFEETDSNKTIGTFLHSVLLYKDSDAIKTANDFHSNTALHLWSFHWDHDGPNQAHTIGKKWVGESRWINSKIFFIGYFGLSATQLQEKHWQCFNYIGHHMVEIVNRKLAGWSHASVNGDIRVWTWDLWNYWHNPAFSLFQDCDQVKKIEDFPIDHSGATIELSM